MKDVSVEEYLEATESYLGFCTECGEFTTPCCEPDARRYRCEECGQYTVFGAEESVLTGLICPVE